MTPKPLDLDWVKAFVKNCAGRLGYGGGDDLVYQVVPMLIDEIERLRREADTGADSGTDDDRKPLGLGVSMAADNRTSRYDDCSTSEAHA